MKIIIIGFMGVGKTTIGKLLANKLNIDFIDMDEEIEKSQNSTIDDIFKKHGEEYFRDLEREFLRKLVLREDAVISTGGGIVTREENCKLLESQENVIFLDASVETIIKNVSNEIDKRPLLKGSTNLYKQINDLLSKRYKKYKTVSSIRVDTDSKNIEEVVSQILVYIR